MMRVVENLPWHLLWAFTAMATVQQQQHFWLACNTTQCINGDISFTKCLHILTYTTENRRIPALGISS